MVLDKAPGLLVHPTKPGPVKTLWDHLRELLASNTALARKLNELEGKLKNHDEAIAEKYLNALKAFCCEQKHRGRLTV